MTSFADLPTNEQAFVKAVAKLGMDHGVSVFDAIRLFGFTTYLLTIHMAAREKADEDRYFALAEQALSKFAQGYGVNEGGDLNGELEKNKDALH
jgi:hypothetical protein